VPVRELDLAERTELTRRCRRERPVASPPDEGRDELHDSDH